MTVRIRIQSEAVPILRQMAKEAGVGISDLAEIACYNLIALYQKDRGIGEVALDTHDGLAGASVLDHVEVFDAVNRR